MKPITSTYHMTLRQLLQGFVVPETLPALHITGLCMDSRSVQPGDAFIALPGLQSHGITHAQQALQRGASVVLWEPTAQHSTVTATSTVSMGVCVAVSDLSRIIGALANRFYGEPSASLNIAAVTGTNGKSTTAYLIAAAAEYCGLSSSYMGTVGVGRIDALQPATHTTPDVVSLHRELARFRDDGAVVAAIEVSSHALHQQRIAAARIDTAVFTNLSRDHLDYHGSMEQYAVAKAQLFEVPGLRHQAINADDEFGRKLLWRKPVATMTTAFGVCAADYPHALVAEEIALHAEGLLIRVSGHFGRASLRSPLLGRFNAENLLAALAVLLGWKVPLQRAIEALAQCAAPPGRMELHRDTQGRRVVIDYAHTPDALEKALQVLKAHTQGRVLLVFGCGGDRDAGKRPQMGAVAARHADAVILTDDNPRNETPARIVADILGGMAGYPVVVVHDRAQAIAQAIAMATPADVVLVAGKGHEDYQLVGNETRHFSDRETVLQCLGGAA